MLSGIFLQLNNWLFCGLSSIYVKSHPGCSWLKREHTGTGRLFDGEIKPVPIVISKKLTGCCQFCVCFCKKKKITTVISGALPACSGFDELTYYVEMFCPAN